jgi:hypothetical protein
LSERPYTYKGILSEVSVRRTSFFSTVEVYDISTPTAPVHVGELNGGIFLSGPVRFAVYTVLG